LCSGGLFNFILLRRPKVLIIEYIV